MRTIKCGMLNISSIPSLLPNGLICDHKMYLFCLIETQLQEEDYVSINESTPPGSPVFCIPSNTGWRGGVAAIYHSNLLISPRPIFFSSKLLLFLNLMRTLDESIIFLWCIIHVVHTQRSLNNQLFCLT